MTEKEIQDAKTAPDKRELERRYVAKNYPLNLKGYKSEQAQARYNYYANKVLSKMDSVTYSNLRKGMPAKVVERQAYIDKFAKDNPKFYTKDLANIITPEEVADMTAQRDIIERNRGLHTLGTKEEADAFGTRHAALIEDARVHSGYSNDPNSEVKYIISWDPEKGYKADIEDFKFGTRMPAPREEDLRQIAIDIEKERILNTSKEKDLADTPELKKGIDFSSVSAYKKWLAFGHASGEFAKTPGHQKVSIKGNKKEVKHKLENGLDFMKAKGLDPNAPIDTKTLAKMPEAKVPETEVPATKPETSKPGMSSGMVSGITGAVGMAGSIVGALDQQSDGKTSVAGSALSGASTGAAAGASVGGPIGAAVGGGLGGATSAISSIAGNKKIDKMIKEENQHKAMIRSQSQFQPTQNTQSPIYENGTYASKMTEPVEVEKDEVVLRKGIDGLYKLVADFKGGKSHEKGGEDYILKEGDVVFPGKKRDKIMKSLETGDTNSIEKERAKLPKTLPNKLEEGYGGPKLIPDYIRRRAEVMPYKFITYAEAEYNRAEGERNKRNSVPKNETTLPKQREIVSANTIQSRLDWWNEPLESTIPTVSGNTSTPQASNPTIGKSNTGTKKTSAPVKSVEKYISRKEATVSPKTTYTPSTELQGKDLMFKRVEDNRKEVTKQIAEQEQLEKSVRRGKLSESLENIGSYAPAISNIAQGMQRPSRVTKRFLTPDTLEYKDRSAGLRKESDIQARIDAENADRFSGGSAQAARAGKAMASTAKSKRSQAISEGEAVRADAIQAQNVGMRNQAKAGNIELANQYETMDAQNRAAVDAYFNRGMSDLYNIGRQKKMDKKMEKQQDLMLKMLEQRDFAFDKDKSEVKYKGKK